MAPPRKFRNLPKTEQARRISAAETAGRLTADKAEAARRFWSLPPASPVNPGARLFGAQSLLAPWEVPPPPKAAPKTPQEDRPTRPVPIKSGGRLVMVPGYRTPAQLQAADRVEKAAQVVRATRMLGGGPKARQAVAKTLTPERAQQLRRTDVIEDMRQQAAEDAERAKHRKNLWSVNPIKSGKALDYFFNKDIAEPLVKGGAWTVGGALEDMQRDIGFVTRQAGKLLSPQEKADLADYWRETKETNLGGAQAAGRFLGRHSGQQTKAELQHMGFDESVAEGAAEVVSNFVQHISEGTIGFPVGAAELAVKPATTGKQIAAMYKQLYEPLARGDLGEFAHQLKENPDMALDWLGALGVGAGLVRRVGAARRAATLSDVAAEADVGGTALGRATRALVTGKEPTTLYGGRTTWGKRIVTRTHKYKPGRFEQPVDTGVQRYVPGSAAGVALTDAWDSVRTSFGNKGRIRKGVRESIEQDRARLFGEIESYRTATRNINRDPALSLAFDRWAIYGGDSAEALDSVTKEIALREADPETYQVTQAQQVGLEQLRQAAQILENPPAELSEAVDRGRVLANQTQEMLIGAGVLNPITAERMLNVPVKWLEDAPEIDSPVRDQMEEALRSTWRSDDPQQQEMYDQRIDLTLRWLDANAASYQRRTGGSLYDDLYSDIAEVEHADIHDELLAEDPDVLAQYGVAETPLAISEARSRLHRTANEALRGERGPEAQARALKKAQPKWAERITTIPQKAQRIVDQIPSRKERAEFAGWYRNLWPEFERYFGDEASNAIRSFLISQAAMSPSDGVLAMLKILEYYNVNGRWPKKGTISHNTEAMVNAWQNAHLGEDPAGVAAKIADFFGSAYGSGTRAWMQDMPNSGPGVVDRWTLRSDGFVDHNSYGSRDVANLPPGAPNPNDLKRLKKIANDETRSLKERNAAGEAYLRLQTELRKYYDMSSGPSYWQYEWSSIRLNQLREHLNEIRLDGRSDWSVDEAQALDWFATRREWGEASGGWDQTWARNTFDITGQVTGDMRKEWLAQGARGAIITEATTSGATGHVRILGTPTQAVALAKRLADETGRPAYSFYDYGKTRLRGFKSAKRIPGLIVSGDPDKIFTTLRNTVEAMADEGHIIDPQGGRVRIMWADRDGKALGNVADRDRLVEDLRQMGLEAEPTSTIIEVTHGRARPHRSLYRGDDPRGVVARAAAARRRRTDFRVGPVAGRSGARRFISGLAANARAWSLSPRSVEDFLQRGYRGFLTDDGNAGAAISPDGEIVSVFNSGSFSGAGGHVLVEALANGGYWLNAYDGFLPPYYANLGFREVARMKFSDRFAPEGWDYKLGRPDVVFMAYAPHRPVSYGKYISDWDKGEELAKSAGRRGLEERPIDSILEELANRGDGMPHQTLAQWRRQTKTTAADPVLKGAVRLTPDGAELMVTQAADFSTLVHENAHVMLKGTLEWLRQSDDPRLEGVMRSLDVKDLDGPISVEAQELFARAVEVHTYLGTMSAPQLRRLTDEASAMMKTIYNGIRQITDSPEQAEKIKKLLRDPEFSTLLDDLIDTTYGVQRRPDAIFMPRLPPTAPSKMQRLRRYAARGPKSTPTPPRVSPVRKGSRNIRFEQMESEIGPDVIAKYATAAQRYEFAQLVADEVYRSPLARPLDRNALTGRFEVAEGHVPFVHGKATQAMRLLDEEMGKSEFEEAFFDREPQEVAQQNQAATTAAFQQASPDLGSLDDYSLEALVEDQQIVQIPEWLYADYVDGMTGAAMQSKLFQLLSRDVGLFGKIAMAPVSTLNTMQRWNMVLKPAYMTTNFIGAMATATAHNPLWVGEIKKASDHLSSWQPATLRHLDEMVGAGSYELAQIVAEDTRGLRDISKREREAFGTVTHALTLPERRVRRALAARQLRMAGYGDEADFLALVEAAKTDEKARALYNQISRHAEDNMVRFRGQTAVEKMIIRRAFFVYGWLRASLRYTARFPLEHPVLAAVMNRIGQEGWDVLQTQLERAIGFRGGIVEKLWETPEGERMARMLDLSSVLPFATGTQTLRSLSAPAFSLADAVGLDVKKPGTDNVSDLFSQGVLLGLGLATGEPPKTTLKKFMEAYGPEGGFSQVPALNQLIRISDPATTETKTFGPRTRDEVLLSILLGQLVPRDTKLDAAQETWLKQQPVGISAPIRVQKETDTLLERYAAAVEQRGDYENASWNAAVQAHASYSLSSSLHNREWSGLDQQERDEERAILKAKILQYYYPEVYDGLKSRYGGAISEESVDGINQAYSDWISQPYSEMRSYIRDTLGEAAVP